MTVLAARAATAEKNRQVATIELEELLRNLRQLCSHPRVIEVEYKPQVFFPSLTPRRLCLDCGVEERGWGSGYQVLTSPPLEVLTDRDIFYARRPFPHHTEEWSWCCGTRRSNGHPAPASEIGRHLRCAEHLD